MKISLLQNNITWAAPVNNHKHIEQLLSKADVADLYVLPEMFSTGFCTKPENIAEPLPCKTVEWMCTTAKEKGEKLYGAAKEQIKEIGKKFQKTFTKTTEA